MKHSIRIFLPFLLVLGIYPSLFSQITCTSGANLFVYANYDGGVMNIDVNVNIPNIKIGICTYEPTTINITGAYVGNVTEVRYAGYVSTNNFHCSNSPSTTTITGVPSGITSVNFLPPSTLSNPNGYGSIVCAYSCGTTSNQGGCNTADQIKNYFQQTTGGVLTSYFTQYGCWSTTPYQLSTGGNCCSAVVACNLVAEAGPNVQVCPSASTTLTGSSTGGGVNYSWTPTAGLSAPNSATTMASPNATTLYYLTVTDGSGVCTSLDSVLVTVLQPQASVGPFQAICETTPPILLSSGSPSGGTYSGTGVTSNGFDPSVAGVGTHTISYAVVSGGCNVTATSTITVNATPQVSHLPIGPFCLNDPLFTLSGGNPTGGNYVGNGVSNGVLDPSSAGVGAHTIHYNFVDSLGCQGLAAIQVVVNANPNVPVLNYAAPNLSTTSSGDSIQWFFNGSYLLTNGSSIVPQADGNYSAVVWQNGCPSDASAPLAVVLVGLEKGLGELQIVVYPNPVQDVLQIEIKGRRFKASLLDALGRLLISDTEMDQNGNLSMRDFKKGIYFLQIECEGQTATFKILK